MPEFIMPMHVSIEADVITEEMRKAFEKAINERVNRHWEGSLDDLAEKAGIDTSNAVWIHTEPAEIY